MSTTARKDAQYPMYDGIGSYRTATNSSGLLTGSATYEGFGQTVSSTLSGCPYRFGATSGYRNDSDAGRMLVGARYYDPVVGQFITRDTDLSQLPYVYCGGDPINNVDPSGHDWWKIAKIGLKIIFIVPAVVEIGYGIHDRLVDVETKERMRQMYRDWIRRGGQDDGNVIGLLGPNPGDLKGLSNLTGKAYRQVY